MARSTTPTRNKLAASTSPLTAPVPDDNGWQPKFTLDLNKANAKAFKAVQENFAEWRKSQPVPDLKLPDGWTDFTPEICEAALLLNSGNRQVSFAAVGYYYRQMAAGEWMKTGQPVIFDVHGKVVDFQHRAWACYLGNVGFTSYVVNQTEEIPNGFAYIDNSKARSLQDALYTAGLNGLSGVLAQTVKLAWLHESGALTPAEVAHADKLTPRAGIAYVHAHPNLRQATRLMAGQHSEAAKVFGYRDVASFLAFLILEHHNEFTLDEFMEALAVEDEDRDDDDPIAAFQEEMHKDRENKNKRKKPMKRHMVLGYGIKTFNAWHLGERVSKLALKVNEDYPEIVPGESDTEGQEQQEAAE